MQAPMNTKTTTESSSDYNHLEQMSTLELLTNINNEDKKVPYAIEKVIPEIMELVDVVHAKMSAGGRLFYIGAGTSGRLGVLDASECPPTFGVPDTQVIGLIAGGDGALRKAVENAEDDTTLAWKDLQDYTITDKDVLVGIAASGTTPYVIGGVQEARKNGIVTGCVTCNDNSPLAKEVDLPIAIVSGPEFLTGSTRMKAGTAQKLVLNMITTSVMIKLGKVKGNKMVNMQLSNKKLVNRGITMLMDELLIEEELATYLLTKYESVQKAIVAFRNTVK